MESFHVILDHNFSVWGYLALLEFLGGVPRGNTTWGSNSLLGGLQIIMWVMMEKRAGWWLGMACLIWTQVILCYWTSVLGHRYQNTLDLGSMINLVGILQICSNMSVGCWVKRSRAVNWSSRGGELDQMVNPIFLVRMYWECLDEASDSKVLNSHLWISGGDGGHVILMGHVQSLYCWGGCSGSW